jgi:benzaldehyde dehydrogenase (NAD)
MNYNRLNPLTQEVASTTKAMSPAQACEVVDRAAAAFSEWSSRGPSARRMALMDAAAQRFAGRCSRIGDE